MGMLEFGHPGLLLLLPLALVPILIHMFHRTKVEPLLFSTLELVLAAKRQTRRRLVLRNYLLLLLKILALLAILAAGAKPVCRSSSAVVETGSIADHLVAVDISASMGASLDGSTLLDRAKDELAKLIEEANAGDRFHLLAFDSRVKSLDDGLHGDRNMVLRTVRNVAVSFMPANPGQMLTALEEFVTQRSDTRPLRVIILSDFAGIRWKFGPLEPTLKRLHSSARLILVDVTRGRTIENAAVTALHTAGDGENVSIQAELFNNHPPSKSLTASLRIGALEVAHAEVRGAEKSLSFSVRKERLQGQVVAGTGRVPITLHLDDLALTFDDNYSTSVPENPLLKALIVADDGNVAETAYLETALNPQKTRTSRFLPQVVPLSRIADTDLTSADAIFIIGLRAMPTSLAGKLHTELRRGKPVVLVLGKLTHPDSFAAADALQPWQILGTVEKPGGIRISLAGHAEALAKYRLEGLTLEQALFNRYYSVAPLSDPAVSVILALENDAPLLLVSNRDRGPLFLFTSSASDDWSNFPYKTSYLPFWHELVAATLPPERSKAAITGIVGEELHLDEVGRGVARLEGLGFGRRAELSRAAGKLIGSTDLLLPDTYLLTTDEGTEPFRHTLLSLNVDSSESDTVRNPPPDFLGGELGLKPSIVDADQVRLRLWPWLLLLGLLAFSAELLMLWKST